MPWLQEKYISPYAMIKIMNEEEVVIVNLNNRIIVIKPRSIMRKNNLIHRAAYKIVINMNQEILVRKRSIVFDVYLKLL